MKKPFKLSLPQKLNPANIILIIGVFFSVVMFVCAAYFTREYASAGGTFQNLLLSRECALASVGILFQCLICALFANMLWKRRQKAGE